MAFKRFGLSWEKALETAWQGAKVPANAQMLIHSSKEPPQHWTWCWLEEGTCEGLAFTAFVWQEAQEQAAQSPGSSTQLNAPETGNVTWTGQGHGVLLTNRGVKQDGCVRGKSLLQTCGERKAASHERATISAQGSPTGHGP